MAAAMAMAACAPPVAERRPHAVRFGRVEGETRGECDGLLEPPLERQDDYFWLRDDKRADEAVLAHLRAENAHFESAAEAMGLKEAHAALYAETKAYLKESDTSAPEPHGEFEYYRRTVEGKAYALHCRRPRGAADGADGEQVVLDENAVAEGMSHCEVHAVEPSPSQRLLAYTVDATGFETYDVRFVDLQTGEAMDETLKEVDGGIAWGDDDRFLYYAKMDDTHRPYQLWRHALGTPQAEDVKLLEEADELYWMGFGKTRSGRFLVTQLETKETAEVHLIDLRAAEGSAEAAPRMMAPRERGVLYEVDHLGGDRLAVISTCEGAVNFLLLAAPVPPVGGCSDRGAWEPMCNAGGEAVMPYDEGVYLTGLEAFESALFLEGRRGGYTRVWRIGLTDGVPISPPQEVRFESEACECNVGPNHEFSAETVRLQYSSMVAPQQDLDLDLKNDALTLVKQKEVPGYDPALYETVFDECVARDGARVPISIVRRKGAGGGDAKGPAPMLLYGYGSYGVCIDPSFDYKILPLLDRGMQFAIAHIRGGGEVGRQWYHQQGKFLTKKNTFNDFVDSARHLISAGYTTPEALAINGRSAGGLLMGAVVNQAPELFKVVVAGVPFVDVMTTMCDASIPLTVEEWEEWGNPNAERYHKYMSEYSPMDNIQDDASGYPTIFMTAGLNDPRVAYWEPAKWAAKLRERGAQRVLAKFDLSSGHFSASDRYKYIAERCWDHAVVLAELGLPTERPQ